MYDELNALRRVYDAGDAEGTALSPDAETEAAELAEVKAALDALPPQPPPATLLEAVVVAASGAALGPIRTVYDETPTPLATPEARAEAAALEEVKAALDALPPERPAPALVETVVAAAATPDRSPHPAAAVTGRAADRPARRSVRRRGAVVALSAAFALVLALGFGLWPEGDAAQTEIAAAERTDEAPVAAEETAPAAEPLAEVESAGATADVETSDDQLAATAPPRAAPEPVAGFRAATERRVADAAPAGAMSIAADVTSPAPDPEAADEEALPLADGDEELRLFYLRVLEMQAAQAGIGWDGAPDQLGTPPDSTPAASPAGWMQVRVER